MGLMIGDDSSQGLPESFGFKQSNNKLFRLPRLVVVNVRDIRRNIKLTKKRMKEEEASMYHLGLTD